MLDANRPGNQILRELGIDNSFRPRYNILRWLSRLRFTGQRDQADCAGVAKLADAPDLGSGAQRRMGSSPFARTMTGPEHAVVAQLVERHLAKVEVASPSLVYRSNLPLKMRV